MSVPPLVENSHRSDPNSSYAQEKASGLSGDPVEPIALSADRSRPSRGWTPSFMQEDRNPALVPKTVTPASAASSHRVSRPEAGVEGLPSYRTMEALVSRTLARKFHIIQPVVVYQKTRSYSWASRCRFRFLSCSSRMPP